MTDSPPQQPDAGHDGGDGAPKHQLTFSLLGRVQILRGGRPVELPGRKPWAVLAMLLLHPNHVVSCERLKEGLWGDHPPQSATNTLQAFVSRIRAALGENGGAESGGILETAPGGYVIRVDPEQVDLHRFERSLRQGSAAYAETDYAAARVFLDEALEFWSGEPFLGVAGEPFAAVEAPRIEELRESAIELRLAALLELGDAVAVVADLEHLVARDPTRERPTELLMIALYRAGRQSDALSVFDSHRRELVGQTGLEPGPGLYALQRRILTHDPALCASSRPPGVAADKSPRSMRRTWLAVGGVGLAAAVLGALAGGALHGSGRSSQDAALAHQLRLQRQALDRTQIRLRASQRKEQWLRTRYANQMRMQLRALHWIEFDENTDRADAGRVRNDEAAANAVAIVGTPYTWGGAAPSEGFDCSGLVKWAWGRQGVTLPHSAVLQYDGSTHVVGVAGENGRIRYDRLAIGDLLFFYGFGFVAIYIGHGYAVYAPHTGAVVQITALQRTPRLRGQLAGVSRIPL